MLYYRYREKGSLTGGKSDWGYGLVVPIFGPIIGALLASLVWSLYIMPAY